MKRITFALLAIVPLFSACLKEGVDQSAIDREAILEYLATSNLNAVEHPSGLFYDIDQPGNNEMPTLQDSVEVQYKGYLLNGAVFDETDPGETIVFPLSRLIPGWQIGIPLLGKGGSGTFLIPSRLGYGNQSVGNGAIPPNSVLIFEITLVDFF